MSAQFPFIVIEPYQTTEDFAVGLWNEASASYDLDDGDEYDDEDLDKCWPDAKRFSSKEEIKEDKILKALGRLEAAKDFYKTHLF